MNPAVFRAYDVRGLAPGELDEAFAFSLGQAMVRFTGARRVIVGRDMRLTSPTLSAALVRGLTSQGADVIDVGMVSTPVFYFAVGTLGGPECAGVMVTASHNPKEYNGFKLMRGDVLPIGAATGIGTVRDLALAGPYPDASAVGHITTNDVLPAYLSRLLQTVPLADIGQLKVVIDCGNGMAAASARPLLATLPQLQTEFLYAEPDGNFPNHEANPLKEETLNELKRRVVETGADLGLAYDGDADRIGFVDERGQAIGGDLIHALLTVELLRREPGATVTYSVNESMVVAEEVERHGGHALRSPVGHGLVKPFMREVGAALGGELSTHYHFRDFFGSECTDLAALLVLALMSRARQPLSALVAPLRRYAHSGEINIHVADAPAALAALEALYASSASAVDRRDGLRFDYYDAENPGEDWWFNARASNTEPLLRLTVEAKDRGKMEAKRDEILSELKKSA
jgi:phosphomannomutase